MKNHRWSCFLPFSQRFFLSCWRVVGYIVSVFVYNSWLHNYYLVHWYFFFTQMKNKMFQFFTQKTKKVADDDEINKKIPSGFKKILHSQMKNFVKQKSFFWFWNCFLYVKNSGKCHFINIVDLWINVGNFSNIKCVFDIFYILFKLMSISHYENYYFRLCCSEFIKRKWLEVKILLNLFFKFEF